MSSPVLETVKQETDSSYHLARYPLGPAGEVAPGLELTLVTPEDSSHYALALRQKTGDLCGFALFSDERGVIYQGKALGCATIP